MTTNAFEMEEYEEVFDGDLDGIISRSKLHSMQAHRFAVLIQQISFSVNEGNYGPLHKDYGLDELDIEAVAEEKFEQHLKDKAVEALANIPRSDWFSDAPNIPEERFREPKNRKQLNSSLKNVETEIASSNSAKASFWSGRCGRRNKICWNIKVCSKSTTELSLNSPASLPSKINSSGSTGCKTINTGSLNITLAKSPLTLVKDKWSSEKLNSTTSNVKARDKPAELFNRVHYTSESLPSKSKASLSTHRNNFEKETTSNICKDSSWSSTDKKTSKFSSKYNYSGNSKCNFSQGVQLILPASLPNANEAFTNSDQMNFETKAMNNIITESSVQSVRIKKVSSNVKALPGKSDASQNTNCKSFDTQTIRNRTSEASSSQKNKILFEDTNTVKNSQKGSSLSTVSLLISNVNVSRKRKLDNSSESSAHAISNQTSENYEARKSTTSFCSVSKKLSMWEGGKKASKIRWLG